MSFSTPNTSHLSQPRFSSVYEPAEDSFLFLDALEKDWSTITALRPALCLEMGCGSGIISAFVASNLAAPCHMLCADLNPSAVSATAVTFSTNPATSIHCSWDLMTGNLASTLLPAAAGAVHLILFNPPYVVTSSVELDEGDLSSKAWAGGHRGREVTDRFFVQAQELLAPDGLLYCVLLQENNLEEVRAMMGNYGLSMDLIMSRRCRNEHLHVVCFRRKTIRLFTHNNLVD
ncbi:hypothetical protein RvY_15943 [Ramazzottius varieornatus]|uniref:Methyltransferase HEMK2 n=1 Tax=Ramazzottius varieornatus TaxID=947166 RepID=A0A1D1VWP8_RAMVA|nr:hypothetical protein RvY_15943 [Ramazzottius varieornatus]